MSNSFLGALVLAAAPLFAAQDAKPPLELSAGPAQRAAKVIQPTTKSAKLEWSALALDANDARFARAETWDDWAKSVRAEAAAPGADAARSAKLALYARLQGRNDDAWDHFAKLASAPETAAATIALFLPGVSPELVAKGLDANGGVPTNLPDGITLTPAPPPPSTAAKDVALGYGVIERKSMRMSGIHVGAAVISINVALESDGVQIDLQHESGASAKVFVVLPDLPDFEVYVEYRDWMRLDEIRKPIEVTIEPSSEPHTLFGRFHPRGMSWPTEVPGRLSRALEHDGLVFEVADGDPELAKIRAISEGLHALLSVPSSVAAPRSKSVPGSPAIRVRLADRATRWPKLVSIISLAERWVLAHP